MRVMRLLLVLLVLVSTGFAKKKPNYKYKTPHYKVRPKGPKKGSKSGLHSSKMQSHVPVTSHKAPAHAKSLARKTAPKTQSHKRTGQS
ncbi:MAG TPA: hypothetical protein VEU62_08945 [Bryobacterales bacterium]|nr:hypothetical protein [Bryobacterales bacterium]